MKAASMAGLHCAATTPGVLAPWFPDPPLTPRSHACRMMLMPEGKRPGYNANPRINPFPILACTNPLAFWGCEARDPLRIRALVSGNLASRLTTCTPS